MKKIQGYDDLIEQVFDILYDKVYPEPWVDANIEVSRKAAFAWAIIQMGLIDEYS